MFPRFASLRSRLVIAFLLVSVPPMLASTYVAARLIAGAYEENVQQWLEETTRYLLLQIRDNQVEAARLGLSLAAAFGKAGAFPREGAQTPPEVEIAQSVGYDLIMIYGDDRKTIYASRPVEAGLMLPTAPQYVLANVKVDGQRRILAGATRDLDTAGRTAHLFVGSWVDDESLGGIKIVSTLDLRLYTRDDDRLVAVFVTAGDVSERPLSPSILARLTAKDELIYDDNEDSATYRAVYSGLRDADGQLIGVVFVGLATQASFYLRIGGWELFLGIFTLGSLLSILAGLWMSNRLVRPLRALSAGVRSVTAGDYQQKVAAAGGAEVEELAHSFNSMATQLANLKALEADLRRRDRLAALGEAAMVIAHEVRNPLGIIQASAELVRSKAALAAPEAKLLGYVVDEVRRIEELIRGFLDFAQPKPPRRAPAVLRQVLDRVAAFAAPEMTRRGIGFQLDDSAPGAVVEGDADQLHQAVLNLVLNAMDAMEPGGALTGRIARDGDALTLSVADTGKGVSPEARPRLFEPFFTTKAKGSGLGLAKVRTVAEAHGGVAFFTPVATGGASFTIRLPAAAARAEEAAK